VRCKFFIYLFLKSWESKDREPPLYLTRVFPDNTCHSDLKTSVLRFEYIKQSFPNHKISSFKVVLRKWCCDYVNRKINKKLKGSEFGPILHGPVKATR
jgi:hypothetical protein